MKLAGPKQTLYSNNAHEDVPPPAGKQLMPICKYCGERHWPFRLCPGRLKNHIDTSAIKYPAQNTTFTAGNNSGRFAPTCKLCGKPHWPLDPSCIGKKGARAEARAKAKAQREAKAQARAIAKLRAKAEGKDQIFARLLARVSAIKENTHRIAGINARNEQAIAQIKRLYEEKLATARARTQRQENPQNAPPANTGAQNTHAASAEARRDGGSPVTPPISAPRSSPTTTKAIADHERPAEKTGARFSQENEYRFAAKVRNMARNSEETAVVLLAGEKNCAIDPGRNCSMTQVKDVMHKQLVWADPESTVGQALRKMPPDTDCILVGRSGILEGMLTPADLARAVSPYLRPEFVRWRRAQDDATLQIRVKWIMTRPVETISPNTLLPDVVERMYKLNRCVLPITDENGRVQGLVTTFDLLYAASQQSPTPGSDAAPHEKDSDTTQTHTSTCTAAQTTQITACNQ